MGGQIESLSVPIVSSLNFTGVCLNYLLVVRYHAFNLIDGLDGLAGSAALFASLVMMVISLMLGHPLITVMSLVLSGALIGFLRFQLQSALHLF